MQTLCSLILFILRTGIRTYDLSIRIILKWTSSKGAHQTLTVFSTPLQSTDTRPMEPKSFIWLNLSKRNLTDYFY